MNFLCGMVSPMSADDDGDPISWRVRLAFWALTVLDRLLWPVHAWTVRARIHLVGPSRRNLLVGLDPVCFEEEVPHPIIFGPWTGEIQ